MSTKILVNNKITGIPGIYTQIKSGIRNPSLQLSYGNICIIDTGLGSGYCSLPGVDGEQSNGSDSVYEFTTIQDFRNYVRGGIYWKLAENLFFPSGSNPGVSKIYFVRAAQTTPSFTSLVFDQCTVLLKTKDEGLVCNGLLNSNDELFKGFAVKLSKSPFTTGYYRLSFYVGEFKGLDEQLPPIGNITYDGITRESAVGSLLFNSPEFSTVSELRQWAQNNADFSSLFSLEILGGNPDVAITDTIANAIGTDYQLFAGGTESYSSNSYDRVLDEITELDNTFFLAPDYGSNGLSINNTKLFYHIIQEARFDKFMIVGGGKDRVEFKTVSVEVARAYNSDKVIVVHGDYKESSSIIKDYVRRSSYFKAASVLGRICGLAPQTPLTFKSFNWAAEVHPLTIQEKEYALEKGILCTVRDPELGFVCLQGINTLQKNNFLVNEDSSSYSIAVKRITAQLNKEITIGAKLRFFGTEVGFNRGTASIEDVKAWLFGFLSQRVATNLNDNLIVSFRDIEVILQGDCYHINYKFVPNFEVNKMIFTGIIIEN